MRLSEWILYLRLAWRNVWRHRRRTLIIVIAIGGTMGLMMLYDGLLGGFNEAIYGNAIKVLGGNVQVHASGYRAKAGTTPLLAVQNDQAVLEVAMAQPQVVAASRRLKTSGMATSRKGAFGVSIIGIEPEKELPVYVIGQHVAEGRYLTSADQDVIFIGKGLASAMEVAVGDRITLVGRATHDQMRQRTMTVAGIYDLNMPDIEKTSIYISLAEAQDLYGLPGQSTEVAISLKQIGQEQTVIEAMKKSLPGYEIESWETNFPELKSTIELKGSVMSVFSVIILIIAGIGILNLLLMAVYERTREIGMLGALGLKPRQISWLFVLEGAMMGLVGIAFGMLFGLGINALLGQIGFDFGKFATLTEYMALISGKIYPTLGTEKLLQRGLTTLIICVLAALYPAYEAAQNEPATSLHYV